jgi:hypothetical protein
MALGAGDGERSDTFLREVNKNIERAAQRLGMNGDSWRFVCECGRSGCRATVELTLDEYEEAIARGLLLASGHRTAAGTHTYAD